MSTARREAELQRALTRYLDTYLARRDRAGTEALFSPTAFLVGTAIDEVAYDWAELQRIADRDFAQVPDPIDYQVKTSKVRLLSERFAQTLAELDLELRIAGQAMPVPVPHFRLTFLWRRARQARDDFLDRIAHQYRTPLAIIKTQLKLLGLQPGTATLAKHLDRLGTSAARLEGLFDQALRPGDEGGETRGQRLDLSPFLAAASEQVRQSLLALLGRQPGQSTPRKLLEEALYPQGGESAHQALNTLIRRLRRRLGQAGVSADLILTDPGVGYRLIVPVRFNASAI
jgi:hypothetical protein